MQNKNKENFSNVDSCPICQNSQLKSLRKAKNILIVKIRREK